jgi:hypothetical protein
MVAHTCNSRYSGDRDRKIAIQGQPRKIGETLAEKTKKQKDWGMPQLVACLSSNMKA